MLKWLKERKYRKEQEQQRRQKAWKEIGKTLGSYLEYERDILPTHHSN